MNTQVSDDLSLDIDLGIDLGQAPPCERASSARRIHGEGEEATTKVGISCPQCLHSYSILFGEKCVTNLIKAQLMNKKLDCKSCRFRIPVSSFTITPI